MTKAEFYESTGFGLYGFKIKNHSGYAAEGQDIVCAAISANTDLVMSLLEEAFGAEIEVDVNQKAAEVSCFVLHSDIDISKKDIINRVLDVFYRELCELSQQYPQNINCKIIRKEGLSC